MRGTRLLLVLLVLTALTLTALDQRAGEGSPFDGVRRGVDTALGPVQRAAGGAARAVGDLVDGSDVRQEALERENAELRAQLRSTEDLRRRVGELDALLRLATAGGLTVVPARVSALGSSLGFAWTVTLDAGSDDGVRTGQTVVNGAGLVGRVTRVGPSSATVLLLTDPGSSVGARLTRAGTLGIARGAGTGPLSYAQVEGGRAAVGDTLVTSGSSTFVPDVPVGRVVAVHDSPGELVPTASVAPFVDVAALDLVGIVVEPPRSSPRAPVPPDGVPPS